MESSSALLAPLGKSLIVPSVQELAKKPITTIPPRYVRNDQESPIVCDSMLLPSVPVIDLQSLLSRDSMDSELERLHLACKEWGFFQIINHGVSDMLLEDVRREIIDLFNLPFEEKKKLWQQPDNHDGFGQLFVVSEEQKLDWSDVFAITALLPKTLRRMDFFDKLPTKLRETVEAYSSEMKTIAMTLLTHMAKALKMDYAEMRGLFDNGMQGMRINYYPPCPEPDKAIGFTPHSDSDALTILFQLNETDGLQVQKDGKWVPVKPLHNAFICNVGDMMEIVSNGVYRSIEHRATVNSNKERLSVAMFYCSNLDAELGPVHSLVGPHNPPLFRRMRTDEYLKEFFARKLSGKSYLDFMKLDAREHLVN